MDIPGVLGGLNEAVTLVEAIRRTVPQRAQTHRHPQGIGPGKEPEDDVRANPAGLVVGMDVEVIQMEALFSGTEGIEADALPIEDHEFAVLGMERPPQALAGPLGIEAADALQALPHRGDAESDQFVEVGLRDAGEGDAVGQWF